MINTPARGRPAARREHILERLRRQIVLGRMAPGAALPKRLDLQRRYDASSGTVQAVFDRLIDDGFVEVRPRRGTFVVSRPPHLHDYALVFPHRGQRSLFFAAVLDAAMDLARGSDGEVHFREFCTETDEDVQALARAVRAQRVAGLIIVFPLPRLAPKLFDPVNGICGRVPTVMIGGRGGPGVFALDVRMSSFHDRALAWMRDHGRRRVGMVYIDQPHGIQPAQFAALARRQGLETQPYWMAPISHLCNTPSGAFSTRVMMELEPAKRPDALIITDDNLAEAALAGLMGSPVRVGVDLEVVTHCNYPLPRPSGGPVTRLGFDCAAMVRQAVRIIDERRTGKKPPALTEFSPLFEHEWLKQAASARRPGSMSLS